ncbi:LysE family translocator [Leifsonia naganoensis]|uniref:Threonine/homoserine/homoserine lactone efflux protein n=1 Tax=Leifsonia naganoensis TaxID=150025 RepID=A0A853DNK8_9MICO|nr:LysE family translocator [Leifsonia naganoensis]NYK10656.1 threonine/homoserine/homoserine lactone efflux protein [Leifsonia naganoensis]
MPGSAIVAFGGISLLFILTPGADWAYAISGGLKRRVVAAVTGLLLGHIVVIAIVAAGVGAVIARFPMALTGLTLVGAAYLLWLGWGVLRRSSAPRAADGVDDGTARSWLARGFAVSGLNPKLLLLTLAVLPQFTSVADPWPVGLQIVVLGAVHVVNCAIVYFAVGFAAKRVLSARPVAARVVSRVSGFAMIAIGAFLVVERVAHVVSPTAFA